MIRWSLSIFRRVLRLFLVLAGGWALWLGAAPQSQAPPVPRRLALIRPGDAQFNVLLTAYYPGLLQELDHYPAVRPFLVILENDTSHWAEAYAVEWIVGTPEGKEEPLRQLYIRGESGAGADRDEFAPGQIRLLAPTFNLSPSDYLSLRSSAQAPILSGAVQLAEGGRKPVSVMVDAVIYEDGGYAGPDHSLLTVRYRAVRDAWRDEGAAVLRLTNPAPDMVEALLTADAKSAPMKPTTDPDELYRQLYAFERARYAAALLALYRRAGWNALQVQAQEMSDSRQVNLFPLAQ